mgnify:CR=1 FL=1
MWYPFLARVNEPRELGGELGAELGASPNRSVRGASRNQARVNSLGEPRGQRVRERRDGTHVDLTQHICVLSAAVLRAIEEISIPEERQRAPIDL